MPYTTFDNNSDPYAMKYFGRIECIYIDRLLNEYDKNREDNKPHPPENPMLLIDPNRRDGLKREHPFTKALFQIPADRLKGLIDEEKKQDKTKQKELIGRETKKKLDDLAKAASKFLSEQVEDLEELTVGDDVDDDFFSKKGVLIYPTYFRVGVGEIRHLTFYVNRALFDKEGQEVTVKSSDEAITVLDASFRLRGHPKKTNRLLGTFRVRGENVQDVVSLEASCPGIPIAEAMAEVIKSRVEDHLFKAPLEFEHMTYQVKEGSTKTLRLFAKCPELINQETKINVNSSDNISVPVKGSCMLIPIMGTNYALGEVNIQGRRLMRGAVKITASINGDEAICKVKIIQKEEKGVPIEIKPIDEDFGTYRAMWNDHGGKPNQLLISGRHASIRRYLEYNQETKEFEGDEKPCFRVLLAEIVTDAVCRKSLSLETADRPSEFRWADLKADESIADAVFAQLQKRIRDFVATAHNIMLSVSEIA